MDRIAAPPDYDQPLPMMHSQHLRSEQRAALLGRRHDHLRGTGCDLQARQTASHILRHFEGSGEVHHADEEIDLFPETLRVAPLPSRKSLRALTEHLAQQHRELLALWKVVLPQLLAVVKGSAETLDAGLCNRFHTVYLAHIEHEEGEMLPVARRWIEQPALEMFARHMRERRGILLGQFTPPKKR